MANRLWGALFLFVCLSPLILWSGEKLSLSLERAEALALENNKSLNELRYLVEEARLGYLIKVADYLPKLELISQGFQTQHDQMQGSENKSSFVTQFVLTQKIFSSDIYYNIKIADLVYNELKILYLSGLNDLLYQVRRAYYKIVWDHQDLETMKTKVEVLRELALRMEERYGIGTTTSFDVNQAQVAVSNALAEYYTSKKILKVDQDALVKLLGEDPGSLDLVIEEKEIPLSQVPDLKKLMQRGEGIFLKSPVASGFILPPNNPEAQKRYLDALYTPDEMEGWERLSLSYRPELRRAENAWKIAEKKVSQARGKYLPDLEFEMNYGGEPTPFDEYPRSNFRNQSFQWGVGVTLRWNLFDSLKREKEIRAAKAKSHAEHCSWERQKEQTLLEVRDQLFSIENAMATKLSSEGNVRLAKQTLAQAGERLEIGTLSIFDYQIAVNQLVEAKNIYDRSQFELIDAYYQLRHASGIDVEKLWTEQ